MVGMGIALCIFSVAAHAQSNPFGPARVHETNSPYQQFAVAHAADVTRDGMADILAPRRVGTSLNAFALETLILSEQGDLDGSITGAPLTSTSTLHEVRAIATGEFRTGSGFVDAVLLERNYELHYLINPGHPASGAVPAHDGIGLNPAPQNYFQPTGWQASLAGATPMGPGENYQAPAMMFTADLNGDGNLDLIVAATNFIHPPSVSYVEGVNSGIHVFWGNGLGGFSAPTVFPGHDPVTRLPIPGGLEGAIIDYRWVSLTPSNPQAPRTLVILTEEHNSFGFSTAMNWLQWDVSQGRFFPVIPKQSISGLTSGRISGFEIGDIDHDGNLDTLFAYNEGSVYAGFISYFPGDNQGIPTGMASSPAIPIPLPSTSNPGSHHEVHAPHVSDFDGDGINDLVYLRGFGTSTPAQLVFVGDPTSSSPPNVQTVPLGIKLEIFPTLNTYSTYNLSKALNIELVDNTVNGLKDVVVYGGRTGNANAVSFVPNLASPNLNLSSPQVKAEIRHYVDPRPTQIGTGARIGYLGGRPSPGNQDFKIIERGGVPGIHGLASSPSQTQFTYNGLSLGIVPGSGPSSDLFFTPTGIPGNVYLSVSVPIPNHPSMLGVQWRFQWLNYDPASRDPFPIYPSDALELTVGH